jgi:hypothetical protein
LVDITALTGENGSIDQFHCFVVKGFYGLHFLTIRALGVPNSITDT